MSESVLLMAGIQAFLVTAGIGVILAVLISQWKIFRKIGEPGWKCLVPVLNTYVMFKRFWKPRYFFLLMAVCGLMLVPLLVPMEAYFSETELLVLDVVDAALSIVEIVILVKLYLGMSRSFGYDVGFMLGLLFMPLIFQMILAFGKSCYRGNASHKSQRNPQQEPWEN